MNTLQELICEIHNTPYKLVAAITGGGSEFVGELLKYGGGSSTLLDATIPYNQKAFDKYIKGKPDKYCSKEAAMDLAMASYQRAYELDPESQLIGLGVTCSLTKPREREGRENVAHIAFQTLDKTICYTIDKACWYGARTREQQENCVSDTIMYLLGLTMLELDGGKKSIRPGQSVEGLQAALNAFEDKLKDRFPYIFRNMEVASSSIGHEAIQKLFRTRNEQFAVVRPIDKKVFVNPDSHFRPKYVFSGSFNPFHSTHDGIVSKVCEIENLDHCFLEICVQNVDKPFLNFYSLEKRIESIAKAQVSNALIGDVILSSSPTFMEKARDFYNTTFIVGWDTLKRICDPKYANLDEVFKTFDEQKTRFIVFHRIINGVSSAVEGTDGLDPRILKYIQIIPPEALPPTDVSSSSIRNS